MRVRIATSGEHQIKIPMGQDVREYMDFREIVRNNMIRKFMYTQNTIEAMEEVGKSDLIPWMEENHIEATEVFENLKEKLLTYDSVIEFDSSLKTKADIKNFIIYLPRSCKLIFVTKKKYGNKGQAAVVNDIKSVCEELGSNKIVFGCQFNKQKGQMSHELYFNSSVGIVFQLRLFENSKHIGFDYDPTQFALWIVDNTRPLFSMSRRMDGAYPNCINPHAVWEVKEYYDNKTYGSRVNDGIYETILSGGECKEIQRLCGCTVNHFLFIDGYYGLGVLGKALLLRYIDCFFQGVVDDIIVGTDVRDAWCDIADRIIKKIHPVRGYSLFFGM